MISYTFNIPIKHSKTVKSETNQSKRPQGPGYDRQFFHEINQNIYGHQRIILQHLGDKL